MIIYRLWRAGETELITNAIVCVVSVPLHQVGHAVLGAPAVEDLLAGVVGVDDVGPGDVTEISTFLQLFSWLADLTIIQVESYRNKINHKKGT